MSITSIIPAFDAPELARPLDGFLDADWRRGHLAGLLSRSFPPPTRALRERSEPGILQLAHLDEEDFDEEVLERERSVGPERDVGEGTRGGFESITWRRTGRRAPSRQNPSIKFEHPRTSRFDRVLDHRRRRRGHRGGDLYPRLRIYSGRRSIASPIDAQPEFQTSGEVPTSQLPCRRNRSWNCSIAKRVSREKTCISDCLPKNRPTSKPTADPMKRDSFTSPFASAMEIARGPPSRSAKEPAGLKFKGQRAGRCGRIELWPHVPRSRQMTFPKTSVPGDRAWHRCFAAL